MRECLSCASIDDETLFPADGELCVDCAIETHREKPQTRPQTRRSALAALRHRRKKAQLDLVDLVFYGPTPQASKNDEPEIPENLFNL